LDLRQSENCLVRLMFMLAVNKIRHAWNKGIKGATNSGSFKCGHEDYSLKFNEHPYWKGEKVGYSALHKWVNKVLGKPNKCIFCGKVFTNNKKIGWANISGKYQRIESDWMRLCKKCHAYFDKKNMEMTATQYFNLQGRYR